MFSFSVYWRINNSNCQATAAFLQGLTNISEADKACWNQCCLNKPFKECQKCVREKQGETCIAELRKYKWNPVGNDVFSTETAGSCERLRIQNISN